MGDDGGVEMLLFRAVTSESMECYEEMRDAMYKLTKLKLSNSTSLHLSAQERNLLSVAYKYSVGEKRSSWRVLCFMEGKLSLLSNAKSVMELGILLDYKQCIASEIVEICAELIDLLDSYLLTPTSDNVLADELFYKRMKGDYYRYLAEVETGVKREIAAASASKTFETVLEITFSTGRDPSLPLAHPIRLDMGLSYALFLHVISGNTKYALEIAERTFKLALDGIDDLSGGTYKDSVLRCDLLVHNIADWKSELKQTCNENSD